MISHIWMISISDFVVKQKSRKIAPTGFYPSEYTSCTTKPSFGLHCFLYILTVSTGTGTLCNRCSLNLLLSIDRTTALRTLSYNFQERQAGRCLCHLLI